MKKHILHSILFLVINYGWANPMENTYRASDIKNAIQALSKNPNLLINNLDLTQPIVLPKGISKESGNQKVVVGIDSMKLNSNGGSFKAISYFELPGFGEDYGLSFENSKVEVHPDGFKSGMEVRLNLVNEVVIPFGPYSKIRFSTSKSNFVIMDCGGFKNVSLEGEVIFDKNFLVSAKSNEEVIVPFKIQAQNLNDCITKLEMPSFKLLQTGDLIVNPKQFYLDLSDNSNVTVFAEPSQYQNPYTGAPFLWRGFYIADGTVEIPGGIVKSKSGKALSIEFKNFLIDKNGFTGSFMGNNIISLTDGINEGWPMAIQDIDVTIVKNKIQKGKLNGQLQIPISKKDVFKYKGTITQPGQFWDYNLVLQDIKKVTFDIFDATAELEPTSVIQFQRDSSGRYLPYAKLNGAIESTNPFFRATEIGFENLEIVAEIPYLKDGVKFNWENSKAKCGNFTAEIEDMAIEFNQGKASLGVTTRANFTEIGKNKLEATVGLNYIYDLKTTNDENGRAVSHDWTFEKIKFKKIEINTELSVVKLKGSVEIYDGDKEFGNGCRGSVEVTIPNFIKTPAKAELVIGTKDDYKYMKIYAQVPFPKPVPLFSPSFNANSIIFGFYRHMGIEYSKKVGNSDDEDPEVEYKKIKYVPNKNVDFGLQIGLGFEIPKRESLSGFAVAEFAFNKGGGLRNIVLSGQMDFLKAQKDKSIKTKEKFAASFVAIYDLPNETFHAEVFPVLNLHEKVKGKEKGDKLGPVLIHVGPNKWFVWAGRPSKKLGIILMEKNFANMTFDGYFQMGSEVDPFPDPPAELASILGSSRGDIGMRDDKNLKSGNAILFGANRQLIADGDFSVFYYKLKADVGFDVMLKKYASSVSCKGGDGSPVGWDGWFAKGQAYAYVKAAVGIRVKNDRYAIMDAGVGALLQATLPNPIWAKGTLAGRYSVLGGLISGRFKIPFEFGEKCELVNKASITDIPLISDIMPSQNDKNVSVFTIPQVAFNMPIGEEFSLEDENGNKRTFRIAVGSFKNTVSGKEIKGTNKWNQDRTIISFESDEILPPTVQVQTFASAVWEEKKGGSWVKMKKANGSDDKQDTLVNFTTGNAPEDIPMENVRYAYPMHNQFNFYKGEGSKGYITLKRGQAYLFENKDQKPLAILFARNKPPFEIDYTYNTSGKEVSFDIPQNILNETVYSMVFNLRPKPTSGNTSTVKKDVEVNLGGNAVVNMTQNKLAGSATKNVDIFIHSIDFRASKYNTFAEKMSSMGTLKSAFDVTTQNLTILGGIYNNAPETFETFELAGNGSEVNRLVEVEAIPDNSWYVNRIAPMIYNEINNNGNLTITNRNVNEYGIQPLKAVRIFSKNQLNGYSLTRNEVKSGNAVPKSGPVLFTYDLSWICYNDFFDLRNQAVNKFLNAGTNIPSGARKLIAGEYSDLIRGNYNFKLSYRLPGKNIPGSKVNLAINY